jgi:pimeloyl-ACP methyl ester carboxylesterase
MNSAEQVPSTAAKAPGVRAGQVASKDGSVIAYDQVGRGPAVILVVGALCTRALGPGVKLAPLLAEHFTVFTYDRRGRGGSTENGPYGVEREIEDLEALIEEAGGSARVFGHSSGAVLALNAADRGLRIEKLALYEPPLIIDRSRPPTEKDWDRIATLVADGRRGDAVRVFLKMVGVPSFAVALMRWMPVWRTITAVAHTLPHDGALVREFQRGVPIPAGAWGHVTAPALVLAGGRSPAWMQDGARALSTVLAGAQQRTLEGQTHDVSAKALAPVLRQFFQFR